jgi:hypothetical protein
MERMYLMNDAQTLIQRIIAISPSANYHIQSEEYLVNYESDEVSVLNILQGVIKCLVDDLEEIGVELHCPITDLCENAESIELTVRLGELVLPNSLYYVLKQHLEIKDVFKNILQGSISDNDSILTILQYFGYINDSYADKYEPVVEFFLDKIKSTLMFDQYLTNLLLVDSNINDVAKLDIKPTIAYITYVTNLTQNIYKIIDKLSDYIDISIIAKANRILHNLSYLYIDTNNMNKYIWYFTIAKDTYLSELESTLKSKYEKEIHVTFPFYTEYYTEKHFDLAEPELLIILLHLYFTEPYDTFFNSINSSDSVYSHFPDLISKIKKVLPNEPSA